jgi:hypothetical protein
MYVRLIVSIALVLFAAGVCAQPTNAPSAVVKVDRVVAIVNDEALTQYELDDARRIVQQPEAAECSLLRPTCRQAGARAPDHQRALLQRPGGRREDRR